MATTNQKRASRWWRSFIAMINLLSNITSILSSTKPECSCESMEKRAAGFVIFRKIAAEFEYLLLQASYGSHHWTPPKGHVDPGESDLETAFRETKEEAGFGKNDLKIMEGFQRVLKYLVNDKPKTVVYWLAELHKDKPVVLSDEHQAYKWAKLKEACELSGYKDFQNLLQDCEKFLSQNYKK